MSPNETEYETRIGNIVMMWRAGYPDLGVLPSICLVQKIGHGMRLDLTVFNRAGGNGGGRREGYYLGVIPADVKDATTEQLIDTGTWMPREVYFDLMDQRDNIRRETEKKKTVPDKAAKKEPTLQTV